MNSRKERMCVSKIVQQPGMSGNDNLCCFHPFLSSTHETVPFTAINAAIIGAGDASICRWDALHAGRDAFPGGNLLWEHGQFTTFPGESLLSPYSLFRKAARLLRSQFTTGAPPCCAKPAMSA